MLPKEITAIERLAKHLNIEIDPKSSGDFIPYIFIFSLLKLIEHLHSRVDELENPCEDNKDGDIHVP